MCCVENASGCDVEGTRCMRCATQTPPDCRLLAATSIPVSCVKLSSPGYSLQLPPPPKTQHTPPHALSLPLPNPLLPAPVCQWLVHVNHLDKLLINWPQQRKTRCQLSLRCRCLNSGGHKRKPLVVGGNVVRVGAAEHIHVWIFGGEGGRGRGKGDSDSSGNRRTCSTSDAGKRQTEVIEVGQARTGDDRLKQQAEAGCISRTWREHNMHTRHPVSPPQKTHNSYPPERRPICFCGRMICAL